MDIASSENDIASFMNAIGSYDNDATSFINAVGSSVRLFGPDVKQRKTSKEEYQLMSITRLGQVHHGLFAGGEVKIQIR